MRLLYLMTEPFGVGGVQSDILTLTEDLGARGHTIYVATTPGVLLDELRSKGARALDIDLHYRGPVGFARAVAALRRVVREERIELVAPQSVRSTIAAWTALRLLPFASPVAGPGRPVPLVTTVHNIHNPVHFRYAGHILQRCCDHVIFESRYERDRLLASGLAEARSTIIHSGIDTDRFAPRARDPGLAARYGLDPARHRVFGIVARLSEEKGHRYLVEAFARVHREAPATRLLVVGDGPLLGEVRAQVSALGLDAAVVFAGLQRDVPAHLALLDVFVLASTRESFPLAAREAMAAGKAVIAPRIGGCPEVVDDGVTGYLFESRDVAGLAACMQRAIADGRHEQLGRAARQRVERLFSRRSWVDGDEQVYLRWQPKRAGGAMNGTTKRIPAAVAVGALLVLGVAVAATTPWNRLMTSAGSASPSAGHEIRPAPVVPRPALHQPFVDPVFGTTIVRITDPSQVSGANRVRHYYSKMNPFNADDTRAIMFTGSGGKILYDTRSWEPIKELRMVSGDPEIQWHPRDPNLFYFLDFVGNSPNVRAMFRYDVRTDRHTLLHDFSEYDTARGRLEGNLDREGRYYALLGYKGKQIEAFVYDLPNDRVSRRVPVTERMAADWISVSQSGRYVVLMGGDRSRVYDIEMKHLRDLPEGSFGHADLCLTADGRDVMVYDGADHQIGPHRNINMVDLASGEAIALVRIGWGTTPHVSCRNVDRPGWALVSTQGPDRKYPNHDFEIFWVKLDRSGEVRRVAHHHSDREEGGYFAEQHAVTNRDGTKIVFASNWGKAPPASYLIDLARGGPASIAPAH